MIAGTAFFSAIRLSMIVLAMPVCVQPRPSRKLNKVIHAAAAMAVTLLGAQALFDLKDDAAPKDATPLERQISRNTGEKDR